MRILNNVVMNGTSLGASVNSDGIWCGHSMVGSLQVIWTGTPTGDFTLQASNYNHTDPTNPPTASAQWTTLSSTTVAAGGAGGSTVYLLDILGYMWVRLVYTRTSGTGTVTLVANMKGF